MTHPSKTILVATMLLALGRGSFAAAQEADTDPAASHEQLFSVNPFGYVFEWYNVEYERKIQPGTSLGFTASYATPSDERLGAANAILRFYPQGTAFKGFYVGGRTGAYYVNDIDDDGVFFGAGVEIGYTWLLGANKNWYIGMGGGVTRIFGATDGPSVIPQLKFVNFGYSF